MAAFLLIGLPDLCAREWTDSTGKFKVKAKFVEFKEGIVRLAKEDGQIISLPLSRLSATDQKYVHERAAGSQPPLVLLNSHLRRAHEERSGDPNLVLRPGQRTCDRPGRFTHDELTRGNQVELYPDTVCEIVAGLL